MTEQLAMFSYTKPILETRQSSREALGMLVHAQRCVHASCERCEGLYMMATSDWREIESGFLGSLLFINALLLQILLHVKLVTIRLTIILKWERTPWCHVSFFATMVKIFEKETWENKTLKRHNLDHGYKICKRLSCDDWIHPLGAFGIEILSIWLAGHINIMFEHPLSYLIWHHMISGFFNLSLTWKDLTMIGMLQMISGVCKTWGNALESNFEISGH
jgi:hypothetical protein